MHAPEPMTRRTFDAPRAHVEAHDHAVCVYADHAELARAFAHFLREGIERRDLTVLVHSLPTDDDAWRFVEDAAGRGRRLREDQIVLVSLYRDAFEASKGKIDHGHVMEVVEDLLAQARARDRAGVRIFVDASHVYFEEKRAQEWFAFESWLGRRLQPRAGLVCAYRRDDAARADLLPDILRTHSYRFEAPAEA
ncbi:MAG TPA: MEDS domain-containing protein [Candidatus Thermoplasmatota archaeon]|nr:MEDS domain-containing protein [Candidatus Thermoplasmatota archaeon]